MKLSLNNWWLHVLRDAGCIWKKNMLFLFFVFWKVVQVCNIFHNLYSLFIFVLKVFCCYLVIITIPLCQCWQQCLHMYHCTRVFIIKTCFIHSFIHSWYAIDQFQSVMVKLHRAYIRHFTCVTSMWVLKSGHLSFSLLSGWIVTMFGESYLANGVRI